MSVIQQNIARFKITHPYIYDAFKDDPAKLAEMANVFLEVAKDPEMTALEELEAPSSSFKTSNFRDNVAGGLKTYIQRRKDDEQFGEDYALDQRAKSLAAISRAQKDPTTTLFDDGNKVPSAYTEPLFYNNPEENEFGQLSKAKEPALLADFTSPMPTGARLDPYMNIPKVKGQYEPIDDMVAGENQYPYTPTPDGHHRMPDGSIMPNSEMNPATSYNEERYNVNTPQGGGILSGGQTPLGNTGNTNGILNTDTTSSYDRKRSAVSGNARGSQMPDMKISQGEMLMRMGAAGVGAANRGDSYIEAMGQTYGDIKDANRQAEADAYNTQQINAKAEALAAAKKAQDQEKLDADNYAKVNKINISLSEMQEAKTILENNKNVTGKSIPDLWNRLVGYTVGNEERADRLFLKKLKLDEVMQRVAETKGAISNAEMKLFASSAPDDLDDESIWIAWLDRKIKMQEMFMHRILNPSARLTDLDAPISETMPGFDTGVGTTTPAYNPDDFTIVDETPDPQ